MSTFIRHKGRTHQANTKSRYKNTISRYNDTQYANKEKEIKTSTVLSYTHNLHLVYSIFATDIVCLILFSLMAFDCQEIKGLLTYLFTYLTLDLTKIKQEDGRLFHTVGKW